MQNTLESYVKNYKIFIDTCSLMEAPLNAFFHNIKSYLDKYSASIILPFGVKNELEKHATQTEDFDKAKRAKRIITFLNPFLKIGKYFEIRGDASEKFADNVFIFVLAKFKLEHNLLLITQDNNLAMDALNLNTFLNNLKSVKYKKHTQIDVKRIDENGNLADFSWRK